MNQGRNCERAEHYFTAYPKSNPRFGLIRACLRGRFFEFLTASGVFSKERVDLGTNLLIESMLLPEVGRVLDVGCGYGVVGITAAVLNPLLQVVLTDVNSRAVWLAKQNAVRNGAENVIVKRGSLYEPVGDSAFNCILCNPPVSAGLQTVKAIVCGAPSKLKARGTLQMVVRSKVASKRFCEFFDEAFGDVRVLSRKSGFRVLMSQKA